MTERRYTPEMAVDLAMASDVQVSPDGRWVAFCVAPIGHRETRQTSVIYIAPSDGSGAARPITDSDHNNTAPRWSPDSTTLAFLSDRPNRGTQQLHRATPGVGEATRLTDLEGGVSVPAWARDGREITFTARRKALAGEKENRSEIKVASEEARPRAIAAVPATGGAVRVIGPRHGHVWAYQESPDGSRFAALVSPTNQLGDSADQTWLVVWQAGDPADATPLTRFMGYSERLEWSPDGRSLAVIAARRPDHLHNAVHIVDVESGEVTTSDDQGMTPVWVGYAGQDLLVLNVQNQQSRLDRLTPDGERRRHHLPDGLAGRWLSPQVGSSSDGWTLAFLGATAKRPPDVFSVDGHGTFQRLTDLNPQLDSVDLADMEEVTWQGSDGLEIHGWLLRPPGREQGERLPLIVNVHGGPSMAWGNWFHGTWHDWAQVLAARGFAVLLPNPRGSTGKGQQFTSANRADLGGQDFQDVMLGVQKLIDDAVVDPERMGIGGWSYGGFLTALTVVRTDRFKAAVAGAAVTNWPSKVGTTDIRPFNERNFPGPLHQTPDAFWIRSPVRYLKNAKAPTLVVHGEADERVPVSQGKEFYLGLKSVGVETDFVRYPRQGHAFHEREFQLDLLRRICDWFERYLGEEGTRD